MDIIPNGSKFPKSACKNKHLYSDFSYIIQCHGGAYMCVCVYTIVYWYNMYTSYTELFMYCAIHTHSLCNKSFTNHTIIYTYTYIYIYYCIYIYIYIYIPLRGCIKGAARGLKRTKVPCDYIIGTIIPRCKAHVMLSAIFLQ